MKFVVKKITIYDRDKKLVDISFEIKNSFALVGQSGSGKSLTLKALLGMLPKNLNSVLDIESDFELVAGKNIALVPQNPFTSLSPLTKIVNQFFIDIDSAKKFMKMVDLKEELLYRYPSQLSGGQLQRVIIAMSLSSNPKLLLLDEPTTALDSVTKESILTLIARLQKEIGYKLLFVTHDIASTKLLCDKIAILKNGKIVENGLIDQIYNNPQDEYTRLLIKSNFTNREKRL